MNNIVKQEHCLIKKQCSYFMLGFKYFDTTTFTLSGVESVHILKKNRLIYY
ncbi:hypothetical protein PDN43_27175 [Bacillus cereus]|nr:hypothetical protein [Bacillus cereus]MDA2308351.1 hypothetical protein [Bacillus cereus]